MLTRGNKIGTATLDFFGALPKKKSSLCRIMDPMVVLATNNNAGLFTVALFKIST
jgi:hypothetical protein